MSFELTFIPASIHDDEPTNCNCDQWPTNDYAGWSQIYTHISVHRAMQREHQQKCRDEEQKISQSLWEEEEKKRNEMSNEFCSGKVSVNSHIWDLKGLAIRVQIPSARNAHTIRCYSRPRCNIKLSTSSPKNIKARHKFMLKRHCTSNYKGSNGEGNKRFNS